MAMNPLPPQAYTKETMLKAYAWLQTQTDSIRGIATTPDILVSLYLKAKLNGEASLERPSIQNFKAELKNLAGMMGEFENGEPAAATAAKTFAPPAFQQTPAATAAFNAHAQAQSNLNSNPNANRAEHRTEPRTDKPIFEDPKELSFLEAKPASSQAEMDAQTQNMIREVKIHFNLSSDNEALRMLVAVGFKKVRQLF